MESLQVVLKLPMYVHCICTLLCSNYTDKLKEESNKVTTELRTPQGNYYGHILVYNSRGSYIRIYNSSDSI